MTILDQIFIKPRERVYEKWTLGYDHYALLSKYIYDYTTLINFVKVCTRTTAPFNMHMNLGVNIEYPEDWKKLQTHVIHTDREIHYPFFADVKTKKFDGTLKSFRDYLDSYVYVVLEKLNRGTNVKILFYDKFFPKELITLFNRYIIAFYNRIYSCYISNKMFNIRRNTHVNLKKFDLLLHYDLCGYAMVSRDDIKVQISEVLKCDDKSKVVHHIKLYEIMNSIVEDIAYTDVNNSALVLCNITLPLRTSHFNLQDVDFGKLNDIVKHSRVLFEAHSKCTLCDISFDNILYDVKNKVKQSDYLLEKGLALNSTRDYDNVSFCVANLICFSNTTRHDFKVIVLCQRLYMYVTWRDNLSLEPIGEYACYYKGTNIIVTYCKINSYLFEVIEDIKLLDKRICPEHEISCDKYGDQHNDDIKLKTRFVTDLYVNQVAIEDFNKENEESLNDFSKLISFITLKYNYILKNNTSMNCTVNDNICKLYQENVRNNLMEGTYDIKDMFIDDYIKDCFDVFNNMLIISNKIDCEWYNDKLNDDDVLLYINGEIHTVNECIDSEYVKRLVKQGNPLVKYIVTKDNKFMFNKKIYDFDESRSWNIQLNIENDDIKNAVRRFNP